MRDRNLLQAALEEILTDVYGDDLPVPAEDLVWFQPPGDVTLQYPCIVYKRDDISTQHADNSAYAQKQRYQVTFISLNPDSAVVKKLAEYPYSDYSRNFETSGLNHDVYAIYH